MEEYSYIADGDVRTTIINLTLETLRRYVEFTTIMDGEDFDSDDVAMHMDDIAYMTNAIKQFASDGDLRALGDRIMHQDTFVREYYITTLYEIEDMMSMLHNLQYPEEEQYND